MVRLATSIIGSEAAEPAASKRSGSLRAVALESIVEIEERIFNAATQKCGGRTGDNPDDLPEADADAPTSSVTT